MYITFPSYREIGNVIIIALSAEVHQTSKVQAVCQMYHGSEASAAEGTFDGRPCRH